MNSFMKKIPPKGCYFFIKLFIHSLYVPIMALFSSSPTLTSPCAHYSIPVYSEKGRPSTPCLGYHAALEHPATAGLEKDAILGHFVFPGIQSHSHPAFLKVFSVLQFRKVFRSFTIWRVQGHSVRISRGTSTQHVGSVRFVASRS